MPDKGNKKDVGVAIIIKPIDKKKLKKLRQKALKKAYNIKK